MANDHFAQQLKQANEHYQQHEYKQAEASYRNLLEKVTTPADKGKTIFNLGMTLQALHKYDQAVATYQKIFELAVNDKEPGGHVMEAYRNYRPRAMWQISECQYAQGQYANALASIIRTRDQYPLRSWCGNAMFEYQYRYELHIALCQEQLGRPMLAVKHYFKANTPMLSFNATAAWRLIALYRNANQFDDLANLLVQIKDRDLVMYLKTTARQFQVLTAEERKKRMANYFKYENLSPLETLLDIHKLGDEKQWDKLMKILLSRDGYPSAPDYRDTPLVAAAHVLAESPDVTLPLLLKAIQSKEKVVYLNRWVYYALGLNGSPEAKDALKDRLAQEGNGNWQRELLYSLALAGEDMRRPWYKALPAKRGFFGVTYPPLPDAKVKLPVKLAEVDDFAAYEAKLPATVTLDLSTPENTVKTMLMSAVIGQREVFEKTFTATSSFASAYEDIHESHVTNLLRFESWPAKVADDQTAKVVIKFKAKLRGEGWLIFSLVLRDKQWLVDSADEQRLPPDAWNVATPGKLYP